MAPTLQVHCKISQQDLQHFLEKKSLLWIWISRTIALLLPPYLIFLLIVRNPRQRSLYELSVILAPIVLLVVFTLYLGFFHARLMSRALLKKHRTMREGSRYTFSQAGIEAESPDGSSRISWTGISKATEDKRIFLLYLENGTAFLLPKQCFGGETEINAMKALLRAALRERAELLA